MPTSQSGGTAGGRGRVWSLGLVVALGLVLVVVASLREAPAQSAASGPEGFRTLRSAPVDLPPGIVPEGVRDLEGTAERSGPRFTAAVTFVWPGDRDGVKQHVDAVLAGTEWALYERVFDDAMMLLTYHRDGGDVLSITYREIEGDVVGTAIVLRGTVPD